MVSFLDVNGKLLREFKRFTVAAMDPHTTSKKARTCVECHQSPKMLGLGDGQLSYLPVGSDLVWNFTPSNIGINIITGRIDIAPFNTLDGKQLVHTSRDWLRTFSGDEIRRILDAGRCVGCHDRYDDPVITRWNEAVYEYAAGRCPGL